MYDIYKWAVRFDQRFNSGLGWGLNSMYLTMCHSHLCIIYVSILFLPFVTYR